MATMIERVKDMTDKSLQAAWNAYDALNLAEPYDPSDPNGPTNLDWGNTLYSEMTQRGIATQVGFVPCLNCGDDVWWEDPCPNCASEVDEKTTPRHEEARYYKCPNCGKNVWWEDVCVKCFPW